ncbi:MAG: DUF2834 domain-containing protein [Phormidesmis sp.]
MPQHLNAKNIAFACLWVGFSLYAFTLSPPAQPDTVDLIIQLSSGQWEGLNPFIVTLFNVMGIWPMIYACLALVDGPGQKIAAWPFVAGSFGIGAFALLPYLALREDNPTFTGEKTALLKIVDSPWTGRVLLIGALALAGYGLADGHWGANWANFTQQWHASQFIHVMSLDFCMLCAVVSPLLKDDMARRNLEKPWLYWVGVLVPLFGILFYLSVRSPLNPNNHSDNPLDHQTQPENKTTTVSA